MQKLKQFWQQSAGNRIITILIIAFLVSAIGGYTQSWFFSWTGFGDYTKPAGVDERGKTLWDWLDLLIIPIVLAGGVYWLNKQERETERKIAEQRAQIEREIAADASGKIHCKPTSTK
jgi:hypothetical protein